MFFTRSKVRCWIDVHFLVGAVEFDQADRDLVDEHAIEKDFFFY